MRVKFKINYLLLFIVLFLSLGFKTYNRISINRLDYQEKRMLEDNTSYTDTYDYLDDDLKPDTSTYRDEVINGYHVIIEDDAQLLTSEEENKLFEKMKDITEYGNVAFKTTNYNNFYSTSTYASDFYKSKFGTSSGTLFLIDMYKRVIYIYSDGIIYKTISSSKADIITDNVYKYATNRNYYDCAYNAYDQIYTLLAGGRIREPMKYITNGILSLVISALLGFLFSLKKASLKEVNAKEIAKTLNKKLEVVGDITAIKTGERKVYNPPSDSSSSSGGSHSSGGGGHSSGGGGGHRF